MAGWWEVKGVLDGRAELKGGWALERMPRESACLGPSSLDPLYRATLLYHTHCVA